MSSKVNFWSLGRPREKKGKSEGVIKREKNGEVIKFMNVTLKSKGSNGTLDFKK